MQFVDGSMEMGAAVVSSRYSGKRRQLWYFGGYDGEFAMHITLLAISTDTNLLMISAKTPCFSNSFTFTRSLSDPYIVATALYNILYVCI